MYRALTNYIGAVRNTSKLLVAKAIVQAVQRNQQRNPLGRFLEKTKTEDGTESNMWTLPFTTRMPWRKHHRRDARRWHPKLGSPTFEFSTYESLRSSQGCCASSGERVSIRRWLWWYQFSGIDNGCCSVDWFRVNTSKLEVDINRGWYRNVQAEEQ